MNITDIANLSEEQMLYLAMCLTSAILCIIFGMMMILMFIGRHRLDRRSPFYPARYVMARRLLGAALLVIGTITLFQLLTGDTGAAPKQSEFLPISGLVISTSQAALFTAALLALYNSQLVTGGNILWNIIPIVWFVLIYAIVRGVPEFARGMKWTLLGYYILQLIGYTIVFFFERRKYLRHLENYFDDWGYCEYRRNGVTVLFLCSLAVGVAALASYFFTQLWHLTVFIAAYTAYYFAVMIYFLNYQRHSHTIVDVTTIDDNWDDPERETYKHEIT